MLLLLGVKLLSVSLLTTNALEDENLPLTSKFHQNDYKIKLEWAEVAYFDKHYLSRLELNIFKRTRNCTAGNLTFHYNVEVGNEMQILVQAYKFSASNDYRLFPLRFEVNFCESLAKNLIGIRSAVNCGNFTGCPVRKGITYHVCNFMSDEKMFPPFVPNGRYNIEFHGLYHSNEMWLVNAYGEVYRPFIAE